MKSSVSAFVLLMMVLGFVINAFAAEQVSQQVVIATLKTLQQADSPATFITGRTLGGRSCEASIENLRGELTASIISNGMMGQRFDSFDQSHVLITDFKDDGQKIVAIGIEKSSGVKNALVIETSKNQNARGVKSVELFEEKSGMFSELKLVSLVKCQRQ